MDDERERTIAAGLRHGEAGAWHALYDALAPVVWKVVGRLVSPTDAADVFQETFLAAAHAARGYDPARGTLSIWLGGIARNQVALHYRKRERQTRDVPTPLPASDSPPETAARAELAGLVRATLRELPGDYEELLTGRYLDAAPVEQLAAQTRTTAEAVRSKLARARQAFRTAFGRRHPAAVADFVEESP